MARSKRVLFVAGEVTPFAQTSSIADLARALPEQLQDAADYEARVMMPCYGSIDEREHNLHEVIRLSGTDVPMGDGTESLTVKVASVPDVRLQVYFMAHDHYFQDGEAGSVEAASFPDTVREALFFNRAALETIRKLRWGPDFVHGFGWMSGLVPFLLASEYDESEHLDPAHTVFTPDDGDPGTAISTDISEGLGLALEGDGRSTFTDTGIRYADSSIYPPKTDPGDGLPQFGEDHAQHGHQLASLYDQMINEVPA